MSKYSKLWGFLGMYVVSLIVAGLAFAGFGECTGEGAAQVCTAFGFTQAQVYATLTGLLGALGVYGSPANTG